MTICAVHNAKIVDKSHSSAQNVPYNLYTLLYTTLWHESGFLYLFNLGKKEACMIFSELIRKRYSVRSYKSDAVEDYLLQEVLEAARLAPTAANRQPFQLIVVHTKGREAELQRIYDRPWFVQAPLIICACGIPTRAWARRDSKSYCDIDVAIVMDHLTLAATDLGLGTCWIGAFDPVAARAVLGLPTYVEPIVFTPLGYPNDQPGLKKRKGLAELVQYEYWSE
jgi:nitroreductase